MTNIKDQKPAQKTIRSLLVPVLIILLFAAISFGIIQLIQQQRKAVNEVAWMATHLTGYPPMKLSEKQIDIIKNSAVIISNEVENAGVKVTLKSVCGNAFTTFYKLDVELPKEMEGWSFENFEFRSNDENSQFMSETSSLSSLPDDNDRDNRYSLLMKTNIDNKDFGILLNHGIIHTLHLENIVIHNKNSDPIKVIEGQWDFEILFRNEAKTLELIQEPLIVSGLNPGANNKYHEAKVTSVALSEFSLYCSYDSTYMPHESTVAGMRPVVTMKDGRIIQTLPISGSSDGCVWNFEVPISLDEAAFVKLTNNIVLPIQ